MCRVLSCIVDTIARELNEGISVIEQYALHRRTVVTAKVRVLTS